jgi:hypothetical protein
MDKRKLLEAIKYNRERLEHAVRENNNQLVDEVWPKLIQLEAALADMEIELAFETGFGMKRNKRGA